MTVMMSTKPTIQVSDILDNGTGKEDKLGQCLMTMTPKSTHGGGQDGLPLPTEEASEPVRVRSSPLDLLT